MTHVTAAVLLLALATAAPRMAGAAEAADAGLVATAHLRATPANATYAQASGVVRIRRSEEDPSQIEFSLLLVGLPPSSVLGLHIHEFGDVSGATTQGGHFNPLNVSHACAPAARHVGDLGNIATDKNGGFEGVVTSELPSLVPGEKGFIVGRAIVVHAQPDDCKSQPTGSAGDRLAHGVIGWEVPPTKDFGAGPTVEAGTQYVCVLSPIGPTGTGQVAGNVTFRQRLDGNVDVLFFVGHLAIDSTHGIHIHEFGNLEDLLLGLKAGAHFNPANATHGCPGVNATHHVGDMGNHEADSSGMILEKVVLSSPSMKASSINSILGRAVIVHETWDDCVVAGSAGSRLAQCVIGTSQKRLFDLDNDGMGSSDRDEGGWFSVGGWGVGVFVFVAVAVVGSIGYFILRWRKSTQPSTYGLVNPIEDDDEFDNDDIAEDIALDEVVSDKRSWPRRRSRSTSEAGSDQ